MYHRNGPGLSSEVEPPTPRHEFIIKIILIMSVLISISKFLPYKVYKESISVRNLYEITPARRSYVTTRLRSTDTSV